MIRTVPQNWLDTPEIGEWLKHRDFPYDTVTNMLRYIRRRFGQATLEQLVDTDNALPQSYAHWWFIHRMNQLQQTAVQTNYPVLQKWSETALGQTGSGTAHAVFALLYKWLDILRLDRLLFSDEQYRDQVPRLCQGQIVLENLAVMESRKSTSDYLVEQGREIFQERGWTEGEEFWAENCQKYKF